MFYLDFYKLIFFVYSDFYFEDFSIFYTQTNLISLSDMKLIVHHSFITLEFNLKCKQNYTFEWVWGWGGG